MRDWVTGGGISRAHSSLDGSWFRLTHFHYFKWRRRPILHIEKVQKADTVQQRTLMGVEVASKFISRYADDAKQLEINLEQRGRYTNQLLGL